MGASALDPRLEPLFRPAALGALALPHRIAMAPVTRYSVAEDGCVGELAALYFAQRASAAVIVAETSYVHPTGRISAFVAGLCEPSHIEAWRRVTEAVHAQGGRIIAQLMHGGRFSHACLQPDGGPPLAPSAIPIAPAETIRTSRGDLPTETPRAMTKGEVLTIIEAYGRAASAAIDAGFDAVELHAGNGYLPSQFLSARSNRRADSYGGSLPGRARFALEATEAVIAAAGAERTGVKVSPFMAMHDGLDSESAASHTYLLRELGLKRIGYLHVQLQFDFRPMLPEPFDPLALVRDHYKGPVLAGGGFDRFSGAKAISDGRADVIAFGRRFVANPDLPARIRLGAAENELDASTLVLSGPQARGYIDYPTLAEGRSERARV